ncbi:hypothetical protein CK203_048417 [Vitis vinifera]|uniref:Uncharacterized protein n=1 Tax=Vitis vinifera TaxID=29760 RepID=A0A438H278_VITVI|nr:hypothetical protein CK203_048417 [Vitis vinifera]
MEVTEGERVFFGGNHGIVYVDIVLGLMCGWVVVIEKVGEGSSCWTLKSNLTFTNGWPTLYELPLFEATLLPKVVKEKLVVHF